MILFLTSNTFRERVRCEDKGEMIPDNGLVDELRRCFPDPCRALYFCDDPDDKDNDFLADIFRDAFEYSGFRFEQFTCVDARNAAQTAELIKESNFIILGGGHLPTQNRFFNDIGLCKLIKEYDGLILAISAGSMNSADEVYMMPEFEGEAFDPKLRGFSSGLGLTKTIVIPHYDDFRNETLDGLRIMEDIVYPDSKGRIIYAIPDGSYIYVKDGLEELRGEGYVIKDGTIKQISANGNSVLL